LLFKILAICKIKTNSNHHKRELFCADPLIVDNVIRDYQIFPESGGQIYLRRKWDTQRQVQRETQRDRKIAKCLFLKKFDFWLQQCMPSLGFLNQQTEEKLPCHKNSKYMDLKRNTWSCRSKFKFSLLKKTNFTYKISWATWPHVRIGY
jgi:hypothetical protein